MRFDNKSDTNFLLLYIACILITNNCSSQSFLTKYKKKFIKIVYSVLYLFLYAFSSYAMLCMINT